jgi:hypothetical protein
LVVAAQWGDDRGAVVLNVKSSIPGVRFRDEDHPAGRDGTAAASKFSAKGSGRCCADVRTGGAASAMATHKAKAGRKRRFRFMGKFV